MTSAAMGFLVTVWSIVFITIFASLRRLTSAEAMKKAQK